MDGSWKGFWIFVLTALTFEGNVEVSFMDYYLNLNLNL